jgi:hypothetical protein
MGNVDIPHSCDTYGGTGEVYTGFWRRDLMYGDLFEDLGAGWEDDIKSDIQEVGWGRMAWIDLAQDRSDCVNAAMNLLVP